jgi:hypothetical protein
MSSIRVSSVGRPTIGHTGAAFVEDDEATESGESAKGASNGRVLPSQLDMVGASRDVDHIMWPFAQHLIGDVDLATLRVTSLR